MTNEIVTKSGRFYCVSLTPDICKTPVGASTPPLPYTIVGEFADAKSASPNVKSHSEPVVLHQRTTIPTVKGDAAGSAGGVKSGTVGKQVDTKSSSPHHRANNTDLVQVGREVWMNSRNTVGKIYERGGESARPLLAAFGETVDKGVADARKSVKSAAQSYRDEVSAPLHAVGERLVDAGGKVALAGGATAGAGALVSATGVGVVAGAPMVAAGTAMAGVGGAASGGGILIDGLATAGDHIAEYVLTGKTPKVLDMAVASATSLAEGFVLSKLGPIGGWLKSKKLGGKVANKVEPGKKPDVPANQPPKPPEKPPTAHVDDGKSRGKKEPKSEPPSECCPKNKAPANKPVKGRKPIHFGTGQEVLHQTDFVIGSRIPIDWTRCYRSGAETEDWGVLGARWSTAFTTSVSLTPQGCVYHDDTGRALRLPHLAPGQSHDERKEGFILVRADADRFTLTWRDGSRDTFERGVDGYLPHGYDGVNPMLDAGAALRTERFVLTRSAGRDGRGISVEMWPAALPGQLLLRVTSDDGAVAEAMREDFCAPKTGVKSDSLSVQEGEPDPHGRPRIGCVNELLEDGTRICHARYTYEADPGDASNPNMAGGARPAVPFPGRSYNLISQSNVLGDERTYDYRHHLLRACTGYTGFEQLVEWISLDALRARWSGSGLDDATLTAEYPITRGSSYQARGIASRAADGSEGLGMTLTYVDINTTRVSENDDVLEYSFDRNWLVTCVSRVTDGIAKPLGTREWDSNGMLLADSDGNGHSTRYTYDAAGNLISSTDAGGHTARITYDASNQPISITDPMGHITRRSYDVEGRLTSVTDAIGHTTSYRYDEKGQLVEQVDAKGGVKRLEYDKAGRLRTYIDCSGCATKYRYDERGRLAAVIDAEAAAGQQTRYAYDALGRVVTLTRPDNTSESYVYDADGNLLVHTDAMGHQTHYRYNGQGLLVVRTDAIGQTLRYRYDAALRLVELFNAKDERYVLTYNVDGALTSETGFDGKVTTYSYDKGGQLSASECAGKRKELVRDSRGLLVAKINADGIVRYAYDELGRMIAVAAPQAEHRFAYDAVGQLIEERAAYFLVSPPVVPPVDSSRVPDAGFVMTHAYDELGNRTSTTLPNGRRVDTLRYGSGHWHGTLWQGESIVDVERDKLHREYKRQLGRGAGAQRMSASRSYDPQSRLSEMTLIHPSSGGDARPLRGRRFSYDAVNNLLAVDLCGDLDSERLGPLTYAYDAVGQLLSATQLGLVERFHFDPVGNFAEQERSTAISRPPVSNASVINGVQHPAITANLPTAFAGYRYKYDDQGNVTAKGIEPVQSSISGFNLKLEYDAEQRLNRSVRTADLSRVTAEYFYDAFSRRVAKRVVEERWKDAQEQACAKPDCIFENKTLFVWDGDMLAQELSASDTITYLYEPESFVPMARIASQGGYGCVRSEHERNVNQQSTSDFLDRTEPYLPITFNAVKPVHMSAVSQWLPFLRVHSEAQNLQQICRAPSEKSIQERRNPQQINSNDTATSDFVLFYNCDQLGTPRELVGQNGTIVWSLRAKAWGRSIKGSSSDSSSVQGAEVKQPLRFQGQYEDEETGLFYNRYRYYDPDSARYITPDPVGLLGGLNPYAYASNPTGWVDPTGLTSRPVDPSKVDRDCAGRFRDQFGRFAKDPGWPADRGFLHAKTKSLTLKPGDQIDRYGYPGGTFVSPVGVPFEERALPRSYQSGKPYHVYEVLKPFKVKSGKAAPWFNQKGMGTQHEMPISAQDLLDSGTLREITPCALKKS